MSRRGAQVSYTRAGELWLAGWSAAGLLWIECKQMYSSGIRVYLLDNYNLLDFIVK